MTNFETIGIQYQNEACSKSQALKSFKISCNICCMRGLHIECNRCGIQYAHNATIAAFNTLEKGEKIS